MAAIDFNRITEDFKATNWQDPGTWTVIPKAVVLVAILVVLVRLLNRTSAGRPGETHGERRYDKPL